MSWDSELVLIVRYLIGDVSDTPTYDDDRLETLILIASFQVKQDSSFVHNYMIDLDNGSISPDPTGAGGVTRDEPYMSLVSLKASYILSANEFRTYAGQGIRIKDGESEIDLRRNPETLKQMRDTFKVEYEDKLYLYKIDKTGGGLAVSASPATGSDGCGEVCMPWWVNRCWSC